MPFLTARWSNLILLTYAVPPELLRFRLPAELELDTCEGHAQCIRYEVIHPTWECHAVRSWALDLDWRRVYGEEWAVLQDAQPCSVIIAKGSAVTVLPKRSVD